MSTFKVEVVPVKLEPHPNADTLSLVRVFDNYTVAVRTEDWIGRTVGAYIPPDSVVPAEREQFAFLIGHPRIKAKKLRGIVSQGLLTGRKVRYRIVVQVWESHSRWSRGRDHRKDSWRKSSRHVSGWQTVCR